jgi:hypothetical protein
MTTHNVCSTPFVPAPMPEWQLLDILRDALRKPTMRESVAMVRGMLGVDEEQAVLWLDAMREE